MSKFCVRPHLTCLREQSAPPILLRFPLHRRASRTLHFEPVGQACPGIGLTQPSEATVIFWTADSRVTRPRLGSSWSWAPPWSVASPDESVRQRRVGAL